MAQPITRDQLLEEFSCFFLDAYGVLVQGGGVIPGAVNFVAELRRRGKEFLLVSNDASRDIHSTVEKYTSLGFPFQHEQIFTSGAMIAPYLSSHDLQGAKTLVFGPPMSQQLARDAGADVVRVGTNPGPVDLVLLCDERQDDLLPALNLLASQIMNSESVENLPRLVLVNPDLLYPCIDGSFGMTAGSLAAMIESWLHLKFSQKAPAFTLLGKPSTFIFDQAKQHVSDASPLMLGDQIVTDIQGAKNAGITSCLSLMGMVSELADWHDPQPDYLLRSWESHV